MSDERVILYHMLRRDEWLEALESNHYAPPSLELEGFIHFSGTPEVVQQVGNRYYRDVEGDFVVLLLDQAALSAPVQWDPVGDTFFPHLYGALNLDAVAGVVEFPRDESGEFLALPDAGIAG